MSTTALRYLAITDWPAVLDMYQACNGRWDFFWDALNKEGELPPHKLPFLYEIDQLPYALSIAEKIRDFSAVYDTLRPSLDPAVEATSSAHLRCYLWFDDRADADFVDDLAMATSLPPAEDVWLTLSPATVHTRLTELNALPVQALLACFENAALPPNLRYAPDAVEFESILLGYQRLFQALAAAGSGLVILF